MPLSRYGPIFIHLSQSSRGVLLDSFSLSLATPGPIPAQILSNRSGCSTLSDCPPASIPWLTVIIRCKSGARAPRRSRRLSPCAWPTRHRRSGSSHRLPPAVRLPPCLAVHLHHFACMLRQIDPHGLPPPAALRESISTWPPDCWIAWQSHRSLKARGAPGRLAW